MLPHVILEMQLTNRGKRTRTAFLLITSDKQGIAGVCAEVQIPHI
jgi:hypothetical protein